MLEKTTKASVRKNGHGNVSVVHTTNANMLGPSQLNCKLSKDSDK